MTRAGFASSTLSNRRRSIPVARFENTLKLTPVAVTVGPRGALAPDVTIAARLVEVASFIGLSLQSCFVAAIVLLAAMRRYAISARCARVVERREGHCAGMVMSGRFCAAPVSASVKKKTMAV